MHAIDFAIVVLYLSVVFLLGKRAAVGARSADVMRLVMTQGAAVVGIGVLLGLALAFAATSFLGKFLIVNAVDPLTYIVVSLILVAVALIACYIPARRAAGLDPIIALRGLKRPRRPGAPGATT